MNNETTVHKNHLANEKSPYLLQHADNPVNWYPWGEEAFEKARLEDKPIFLSIGYSTCHWCHVMEHESFEDSIVAALMNDAFIAVKVDREERPDIDNVYMSACRMMTGRGGWPLTIIMTPDRKPFFAGTYIPKESRYGRMGMTELIPRIKQAWISQRGDLLNSAAQVIDQLERSTDYAPGGELGESTLHSAYRQFQQSFDKRNAGFGNSPKFPTPHNFLFLLRYWKRTGKPEALEMVEKTLQAMRRGGIYDHAGFGFHRYSTDARWLVPHFEKMLYDQAMLAMAYTEAYQATGKKEYEKTAREIFTYVLRDMTDADGGFYSAEDADSEGEEGKFYFWSVDEIGEILNDEEAGLIIKLYNVQQGGNFEDQASGRKTGESILHLTGTWAEEASHLKISETALKNKAESALKKLFDVREKRIHPYKDDKVLTDWNGLMIAAFAKAARAFDEPEYARAAGRSVEFILENLRREDGRLLHRYRDGQAAITGNLEDYAFLIWGLIELYQATFDIGYLQTALQLNNDLTNHFWDHENGGFYFTPDDGEELLVRQKEIYDGAIPSGNSVAAYNGIRLSRMTGNSSYEEIASRINSLFSGNVGRSPSAFTLLLTALDFGVGPSYEVVIVGNENSAETREMILALFGSFLPNKVVILRPVDDSMSEITHIAPFVQHQTTIDGRTTVYVCRNYTCNLPTTDIQQMLEQLQAGNP